MASVWRSVIADGRSISPMTEAGGHDGGNRRLRYQSAFGSAQETKAALHIARCLGYVDAADAERAFRLADRIAGACWRMLHKR